MLQHSITINVNRVNYDLLKMNIFFQMQSSVKSGVYTRERPLSCMGVSNTIQCIQLERRGTMEALQKKRQTRKEIDAFLGRLLIHEGIMTILVVASVTLEAVSLLVSNLDTWTDVNSGDFSSVSVGAPYLIASMIGVWIFYLYRKGALLKEDIRGKRQQMSGKMFVIFLCFLLSFQFIFTLVSSGLEWVFNLFGYSLVQAIESATGAGDSQDWMMLLYAGVGAPVVEEIIFRAAGLKAFEKYGKLFTILLTALLFGVFHANIPQGLFAFAMGVLLAFVAIEYSFVWAVGFHFINNSVFSIVPSILVEHGIVSEDIVNTLFMLLLVIGCIVSAYVVVKYRKNIIEYIVENKPEHETVVATRSSILLWIFILLNVGLSFASVTPLR